MEGQESLGSRWPAANRVTLSSFSSELYQGDNFNRVVDILLSHRDMLNNRGGQLLGFWDNRFWWKSWLEEAFENTQWRKVKQILVEK